MLAGQKRRELEDAYRNNFDKVNGNLDEFVAGFVKDNLGTDDKFVASGIREGFGDTIARLKDTEAERKSVEMATTAGDRFYNVAQVAIDDAVAAGGNPSAAARGLYAQNAQAFGLTYAQMDDSVMRLAQHYADLGDLVTVQSLLETDVVGADGQHVGSFTSRPAFADKARALIDTAKSTQGKQLRTANTSAMVALRDAANAGSLTRDQRQQVITFRDTGQISQEFAESLLETNIRANSAAADRAAEGVANEAYLSDVAQAMTEGRAFDVRDQTVQLPSGRQVTFKRSEAVQMLATQALDTASTQGKSVAEMGGILASCGTEATYEPWSRALNDGYLAMAGAARRANREGDFVMPPLGSCGILRLQAAQGQPGGA